MYNQEATDTKQTDEVIISEIPSTSKNPDRKTEKNCYCNHHIPFNNKF